MGSGSEESEMQMVYRSLSKGGSSDNNNKIDCTSPQSV